MNDSASRVLLRRNVPQFLETNAINLRLAILIKCKLRLQQLRKMAAHTFCEKGIFGMQFHARHIIRLMAAIAGNTHIASSDAPHRTIFIVEYLRRREARKDFNAEIFRLTGQPAAQIAKRSGVSALVVHETRSDEMRHVEFTGLGQYPVLVILYWSIGKRTAHVTPVWQQLVQRPRVNDRT